MDAIGRMEALAILGLIVATVVLWRRVDTLERSLADLRSRPTARRSTSVSADRHEISVEAASPAARHEPIPVGTAERSEAFSDTRRQSWFERLLHRFDLEDVFGRLLPIWAGGVTLAIAGFFLVRWAIDAGLLTPPVRVGLAGLFGLALLGGAEMAFRWRERVADPRVAQALAGAGLATLYAAFYLAGTGYGLIGSTLAFVGLASVTAAALGLSFRFGLPSAVLGLVGGFAAPSLVGSEDANVPLLTLYLGLVTAGLAFTGRRQDRPWLGVAALAGGLGWGALLIAGGTGGTPDALALGVYLVLLGGLVPAITGSSGRPHWLVRIVAAGLAAVQLAVLVQQGGFGALEWSLYLLLGAALAWFGWREATMRDGAAVAAAVGFALLAVWPQPAPYGFALVGAGIAVIFAGVPLAQIALGHGRRLDLAQVSGVALGLASVALAQFGTVLPHDPRPIMGGSLLVLAFLPAGGRYLARSGGQKSWRPWQFASEAVTALLVYAAFAQWLPADALAWTGALLTCAIAWRAKMLAGAMAMLAVLAGLWAIEPLAVWLSSGLMALAGSPLHASELPTAGTVGLRIMPGLVGATVWALAVPADHSIRRYVGGAAIVLAIVAAHTVYRHLFASLTGDDFVYSGVIQRAVWETTLLGLAWIAWQRSWRQAAIPLALAALGHFMWFSLALHNPLWAAQAVGLVPIANALVPAYAAGLAALVLVRRWLPVEPKALRWTSDAAIMIAIALFTLSQLRQGFAGSLLMATEVGQSEDLMRSLSGILIAAGFLWWGAKTGARSWRIGSLAVMVIAVLKVFLVDTAGLEGLGRIASFMALGFSLIGIGWFYSRQLRAPREEMSSP